MPIAEFPTSLKALVEAGWVRSYPALDIYFSDGSSLHYSTDPVVVGSVVYEDKLESVKSIRASRSRSVDYAELTIDNTDLVTGDFLFDDNNEDILENLPAVLSTIYVNIRDDSEKYIIPRMSGLLHSYTEDGATKLNITLISDDYAGGSVVPFSTQKSCVWQYKDGINCTYDGEIPTCDLSFNGANGCVSHFGMEMARARFGGGAIDLDETTRTQFAPLVPRGGGSPGGGIGCFAGTTPIYLDEMGSATYIKNFKGGDDILGVEQESLTPVESSALKDVLITEHRNWYNLVFSDGAELHVTATHPFFPEAGERITVADMQPGMTFRRLVDGKWRTVKLVNKIERSSPFPLRFYNVPVKEVHSYFANGFPVSNLKDVPRDEFPYLRAPGTGGTVF